MNHFFFVNKCWNQKHIISKMFLNKQLNINFYITFTSTRISLLCKLKSHIQTIRIEFLTISYYIFFILVFYDAILFWMNSFNKWLVSSVRKTKLPCDCFILVILVVLFFFAFWIIRITTWTSTKLIVFVVRNVNSFFIFSWWFYFYSLKKS